MRQSRDGSGQYTQEAEWWHKSSVFFCLSYRYSPPTGWLSRAMGVPFNTHMSLDQFFPPFGFLLRTNLLPHTIPPTSWLHFSSRPLQKEVLQDGMGSIWGGGVPGQGIGHFSFIWSYKVYLNYTFYLFEETAKPKMGDCTQWVWFLFSPPPPQNTLHTVLFLSFKILNTLGVCLLPVSDPLASGNRLEMAYSLWGHLSYGSSFRETPRLLPLQPSGEQ